jgi:hypothetical protein
MLNDCIPFTNFSGRLKQLDTSALSDLFDLFFPEFRTLHEASSYWAKGGIRLMVSARSTNFISRGRERRFAGDETLKRQRYYCIEDSKTNRSDNNTLLGELFAYADPRLLVLPELLDSTVDVEHFTDFRYLSAPCILHILRNQDNPWFFSPVFGIPPDGTIFQYPLKIVDQNIDRVIDLRITSTLHWFYNTFSNLEQTTNLSLESFSVVPFAKRPPKDVQEFLPALLSQSLGGGTTFIQGIGAWLRANGANALIYPSARSDSCAIVRNGTVIDSFGYILVDYRDAPFRDFDPHHFFGALPSWRDPNMSSLEIDIATFNDESRVAITGLRRLQQFRFTIFHDWTKNMLNRAIVELHKGEKHLGDRFVLALRKPSTILGPDAEKVLGPDQQVLIDEGGGSLATSGFLFQWRESTVASFLGTVLPAAPSASWEARWHWDEASWFLHRKCLRRPWVVLKCPVCWLELFWKVLDGGPITRCLRCNFSNGSEDRPDAIHSRYAEWTQKLLRQAGTLNDQESNEIYAAVCERLPDAVTGIQPPNNP